MIEDPIDELFNLINVNKKPYLVQNDFISFFENGDFPAGMETFDTSKFPTFTEENSNKVTKVSFKKGLQKEISRLQGELNLLQERIELEENIINELEKATQIENSDDEGGIMDSHIFISVMKIRKLKTKINANVWLTVSLEVGDLHLSTEPVNFMSGFALWPNERFTIQQDILASVYTVDKNEQYQLLGKFNISLSSLRDQSIHKRYYKVFDGNKMVCEVLLNLLYIYDQIQYEQQKLERRRETYRITAKRNQILIKSLEEKIQRLQSVRGYQLFEELFSKDVELPSFLSPRNMISPRFQTRSEESENPDYLSETPSIYSEENQMRVFLTSTDEEKIVFQRYIEGHDNPSDVLVIDHSTMKFDFPNSNSPDYIKFDIPLSEFESSKAPSSYHKRSKTLQSKPLPPKSQRKRTIDIGGRNDTNETNSFGFLSLSEIDHHNSNDRLSVSIYSQKQGVSQQIHVSEVPSLAKSSKISGSSPKKQFSFAKNELKFPSIVDEESTQNLKSEQNRDFPIRTNYKLLNPDKRQKFAENAFLIGLAELMKNNNRPKQI